MDTLTRPPGTGACSVELDATLEAARAARAYVTDVLSAWAMPADLIDTARLLTSELASNAITHGQGRGGTFTLEVRSFGCCLSVDVADHSPTVPVLRSPAGDDGERPRPAARRAKSRTPGAITSRVTASTSGST